MVQIFSQISDEDHNWDLPSLHYSLKNEQKSTMSPRSKSKASDDSLRSKPRIKSNFIIFTSRRFSRKFRPVESDGEEDSFKFLSNPRDERPIINMASSVRTEEEAKIQCRIKHGSEPSVLISEEEES